LVVKKKIQGFRKKMAFNIDAFSANINKDGLSFKSDYQVIITPPVQLSLLYPTSDLSLRASKADIPGRSIQTAPTRHVVGPETQVAYNSSLLQISTTFIADKKLNIKRYFEAWQDIAIGNFRMSPLYKSKQFNIGYYSDYVGTVSIYQYDRETQKVAYQCKMLECYPVTINPLDVDWESTATHDIGVTWNYRYFTDENAEFFNG
jgi:hypothetical protein